MGIAVDYSGTGWSIKEWSYSKESGIMRTLQTAALAQLACNAALFYVFGQTKEGLHGLLFWWIAPVLCGYPAVNFIRNLEHADCEVSSLSHCLSNTRSVRSNIVVRTLLWDTIFSFRTPLLSNGAVLQSLQAQRAHAPPRHSQ
jgi:hypothetical protein